MQRRGTKLPGLPIVKDTSGCDEINANGQSQAEDEMMVSGCTTSIPSGKVEETHKMTSSVNGVVDIKTLSLEDEEDYKETSKHINTDGPSSRSNECHNHESGETELEFREKRNEASIDNDQVATNPVGSSPDEKDDDLMPQSRQLKLELLLSADQIDLPALRDAAWSGLDPRLRPMCWRLLLGYVPQNRERREGVLSRKRSEYLGWVKTYFTDVEDEQRTEDELKTLRQIRVDVPRTAPAVSFFHQKILQESLTRILYVRAIRNPASGYVQGLNDLVTPFLAVFLSEFFLDTKGKLNGTPSSHRRMDMDSWDVNTINDNDLYSAEADCYWCLGRLIDQIQDHYTFAQPGIQKMVFRVRELVRRIDAPVADHLEEQGVQFLQFTFRWINCLLVREIPFNLTPRLWDTYIAEGSDFSEYLVYACGAFLLTWSKELLSLELEVKNWMRFRCLFQQFLVLFKIL